MGIMGGSGREGAIEEPARMEDDVNGRKQSEAKEKEVNDGRRRAALEKYAALRDQFFPSVPEIAGEELLEMVNKDAVGDSVVLVDCRSDIERKISIYKGAISQADFQENFDKYKDKEIVAYCAIGRRSGLFLQDLLAKHPGMKVRNHAGSVVDWTHVGGPMVDETTGASTFHVHPNNTWIPYLPVGRNLKIYGA